MPNLVVMGTGMGTEAPEIQNLVKYMRFRQFLATQDETFHLISSVFAY